MLFNNYHKLQFCQKNNVYCQHPLYLCELFSVKNCRLLMTSRAYPNAGNKGTCLKNVTLLIRLLIFFAHVGHVKHQHKPYSSAKAPIHFSQKLIGTCDQYFITCSNQVDNNFQLGFCKRLQFDMSSLYLSGLSRLYTAAFS